MTNPELLHQPDILPILTESPRIELSHLKDILSTNTNNDVNSEDTLNKSSSNDPKLQISNEIFFFFQKQRKDPKIMKITEEISSPHPSIKLQNYFINPNTALLIIKKIFFHPVVPKILKISHMSHFGIYNTYGKNLQNFYWKGVHQDTRN